MGAYWKPLPIVAGLLALLTAIWWQSRGSDATLDTRLHEALFAFEVSDTALNRDVLLNRAGLLRHYDSLVQARQDLRSALATLRSASAGMAAATPLGERLETLQAGWAEKTALVEYFKSDNALLRNSMMYFNTAGQVLRGAALAAAETGLAAEVGALSHAMLRFLEAPQPRVGLEIKAILDRLPSAPASFRADLDLLVIHGRLIVDFLPRVDALLRQIIDAPTASRARALRDALRQHYERAEARARIFRVLLYGISVLLLGYLIYLFARLQLGARTLRRANADLSREMAERRQAEAALAESEQRLRHSQKMEAIGTLAGGIAHEFNNYLAPILGYTELTLAGLPRDSRPRQQLEKVLTAGKRARAVVEKILTFSRRGESARKAVEIQRVVSEALQLLRASLPATVAINEALHAEDVWIDADPDQLHQVIINLGANAAHAMPEGGAMSVRLEPVTVDAGSALPRLEPGRYLRLSLADTGCGMDRATQARIFEPFFTTKETGKGTGLGLAIVHGIVGDHGGAIEVTSAPGRGTTFDVYLPATDAAARAKPDDEPAITWGHGETVLFVDDEPSLVELGEAMLTALGFRPVGHPGGEEALAAFRAAPDRFDLVITDQIMPKLTGLELAAEIRRLRLDIPIILATGRRDSALVEQARRHGIREILKKPLLSRELSECAGRVLAEARGARPSAPDSAGREPGDR